MSYINKKQNNEIKHESQTLSSHRDWKINFVGTFIIVGFAFSVFFYYWQGVYFGMSYPNNTFLFNPVSRLSDFTDSYRQAIGFNSYLTDYHLKSNYLPFANFIVFLFTLLPIVTALYLFLLISIICMLISNILHLKMSNKTDFIRNTFAYSFMTYPFLFLFDRANFEFFVFYFLMIFLYFYKKEKYMLSAFFLACATAMKGFPALLLLLFIPVKRYKEIGYMIAITVLLSIFALMLHKGGFMPNLSFLLSSQTKSHPELASFIIGPVVQRSMSIFTFIKIIIIQNDLFSQELLINVLAIYTISVATLTIPLLYYVVFIEKETWKKMTILICAILLFPPISCDYKLIHLFLPLFLYLNSKEKLKEDIFYLISFGLLLIPKNYYIFQGILSDGGRDIGIAVPLNIIILISLMFVIIYSGMTNYKLNKACINE